LRADIEFFRGRTGQYVFISTASAYQKPLSRVPVTESMPLRNPYWQYSRDKIACEDLLVAEYRESGFPATIVRPSHTYDATKTVLSGGWTTLARMLAGKPVIVHGDGTSLWTVTHHTDFARGFVPLLGHPRAVGEAFHITSDDVLTWDQIARALGAALGLTRSVVPLWRAVVPFERGAREIADWYLADPARQVVDERLDAVMDKLAADFGVARGAAD
jgi:nucleoside-diphosphate-sugar epimerase